MKILNTIAEIRQFVLEAKHSNKTIGLVPTMGFLHEGHASLIKKAKEMADIVIVSIFVNPLQFDVQCDLQSYPRDIKRDTSLCKHMSVDVIFLPDVSEMYPNKRSNTIVNVGTLDRNLCGRARIGHFAGVCTVVSKLFNITTPDFAFFGKKDIQQLRIIETMVHDLNFDISIIGCDIIRATNGLALSSRNANLSENEKIASLIISHLLQFTLRLIQNGLYDVKSILKQADMFLVNSAQQINADSAIKIKLNYLEIVDYQNLQLLDKVQGKFIIATAIFIGNTRLIDNLVYEI